MTFTRLVASCLITAACAFATPSFAQNVKVGLILPMTGPFTSTGKQLVAGARLYMQLKGDTVAGKKIELVVKDDTGSRDHVVRRVRLNGEIRWRGGTVYISEALIREPIGLMQEDDGSWSVFYDPIRLGVIAHDGDRLRKPKHQTRGRVDNASVLPTSPQVQQQQQT